MPIKMVIWLLWIWIGKILDQSCRRCLLVLGPPSHLVFIYIMCHREFKCIDRLWDPWLVKVRTCIAVVEYLFVALTIFHSYVTAHEWCSMPCSLAKYMIKYGSSTCPVLLRDRNLLSSSGVQTCNILMISLISKNNGKTTSPRDGGFSCRLPGRHMWWFCFETRGPVRYLLAQTWGEGCCPFLVLEQGMCRLRVAEKFSSVVCFSMEYSFPQFRIQTRMLS